MTPPASRPLTERQRAVMERIDRRVPIKVIAQELGVSETRVNQHIRALKNTFKAESLGELVERYREDKRANEAALDDKKDASTEGLNEERKPFSEGEYSKNQVPIPELIADQVGGGDPGELVMNDALPLLEQAPWLRPGEPRVVPRALDGENAVLFRLAAIVGIAFGFLAAVVLTVTAALTISEALDGQIASSVDEQDLS